jgi:hypothetical protein
VLVVKENDPWRADDDVDDFFAATGGGPISMVLTEETRRRFLPVPAIPTSSSSFPWPG